MKFSIRLFLATLILMFAAPVFAGNGNMGDCKLLGSWIGYQGEDGPAWWLSTADGQNASRGTLNLEVPGSLMFFVGDGAVAVTELKGAWEKTGENTYDWTVVGFPFLADTTTLLIAKLSGVDTISEDCNTIAVTNVVMELFYATDDINVVDPFFADNFPDHDGHRISVNLPEPDLP